MLSYTQIARILHNVTRATSAASGLPSEPRWENIDQAHRDSMIKGIRICTEKNCRTPQECQNAFIETKLAEGWTYGPSKDPVAKTSPIMKPFEELDPRHRRDIALFCAVLNAVYDIDNAPDMDLTDWIQLHLRSWGERAMANCPYSFPFTPRAPEALGGFYVL